MKLLDFYIVFGLLININKIKSMNLLDINSHVNAFFRVVHLSVS